MTQSQSGENVFEMATDEAVRNEEVEYAANIRTVGRGESPDTVVLVTAGRLIVGPKMGEEDRSALDFSIALDDIERLRCEGFFSDAITIDTAEDQYEIPAADVDSIQFTDAIVDHTELINPCERYGFGRFRFTVCKWSACIGCSLILIGTAISITIVGLLLGLPVIGVGAALLLFTFLYKKMGDRVGDCVWTRPERGAESG